jgi:hypothetical protein
MLLMESFDVSSRPRLASQKVLSYGDVDALTP